MTQNPPILTIVAIAILISVIIPSVFIVLTHLKLLNQLQSRKILNPSTLYTFGGKDENGTILSSGSRFNSSTGEWTSISPMPQTVMTMCGAVNGNRIYLFGGLGENKTNIRSNSAKVYDCLNNNYTTLQQMPEARDLCGAAVLNSHVYVAGGREGNASTPLSSVIRYDIQTDQWSTVSSMNTPRSGFQLVELDGRLYAIGGNGMRTVEIYNSSADQWSFVGSTQYPHNWFGAAVHEGKIYVKGEYGFEVYSPRTDQWNTLPMPTFHNEYFQTLVSMNGKLWVTGGSYYDGYRFKAIKTVLSYEISTRRWTKQRDMDVARLYHTAFVISL